MNKKGNVPTIILEDGSILSENVAVLTWLSQQGDQQLGFPPNSPGYYRMLNATAFISSELHSTLGVLFYPTPSEEVRRKRHTLRLRCDVATRARRSSRF